MVKTISLDTSSKITGWAYWEQARLVSHGVIDLSHLRAGEDRLDQMSRELMTLMTSKNPDIVVVEMPVVTRNTGTQRALCELIGVVYGWCIFQRRQRCFYSIRPTEWRKLVRNADERVPKSKKEGLKAWDVQKAKEIFGIEPVDDNEADAVLIGLAYMRLFETDSRAKMKDNKK